MKTLFAFCLVLVVVSACTSAVKEDGAENLVSTNVYGDYFYSYDTIPKIYVYRNITNGLEEIFHRVFSIEDTEGNHIVVEIYINCAV